MLIVFSEGVYLGKHTLRPASVEFVCLRHTNYARSRMQAFSNGKTAQRFPFESVSKTLFDTLRPARFRAAFYVESPSAQRTGILSTCGGHA